ncbi:cupin domain-containing protein [Candidatus Woesearchaeota archaeon]|nr:cupin domain-containing protein [Candidatus Woesearchaeota archaeon]
MKQEWEQGWCGKRKTLVSDPKLGIFYMQITDAPMHYHKKSTELYIITEGEGMMFLDGDWFEVKKYDSITINPLQKHALKSDKGIEVLVVSTPLVTLADHYLD